MDFELIGDPSDVEIIAVNLSIRENADLKARHGGRRWRKLKGVATVRLASGSVRRAEVHWFEAHGVGKRKDGDQASAGLTNMADQHVRPVFAVRVANDGCDDLSAGMLDQVLPDEAAAREGLLRVVDDSGEDSLYPAHRFVVVAVPREEEPRPLAVAPANVAFHEPADVKPSD